MFSTFTFHILRPTAGEAARRTCVLKPRDPVEVVFGSGDRGVLDEDGLHEGAEADVGPVGVEVRSGEGDVDGLEILGEVHFNPDPSFLVVDVEDVLFEVGVTKVPSHAVSLVGVVLEGGWELKGRKGEELSWEAIDGDAKERGHLPSRS